MRSIFTAILVAFALLLGGCATSSDVAYYKAIEAQANAEAVRYTQLGEIGKSGDTTAKAVSAMALQGLGSGQNKAQIAPPKSAVDTALQAASIFMPSLVQAYGMRQQTILGQTQSTNAADVAKSTNSAFVGIASQIQAPAANVTTTNTTNTTNTSTSNATTTKTSTSVGDYSGSSSGNSGRIAGGDITDSTHAPTVVTQPAPVIVPQPAAPTPTPASPPRPTDPFPVTPPGWTMPTTPVTTK